MSSNSSVVLDGWCSSLTYSNISISAYYQTTLVVYIVTSFLAPMTVLGNALILAEIWRNPSFRTPSYVLLAGWAFTDFCTGLLRLLSSIIFKKRFFYTVNNTNNITSNETFPEEDAYVGYKDCPPLQAPSPLAAKIAAYVMIIVISLVGNILMISVTRRTRSMRRKFDFYFVVNMAIADLLTTMINTPESLAVEIRDSDEWMPSEVGVVLCKLAPFCQEVCAFCSVLNLLAIALDRFFATRFPFKRIMTRRFSKIIILSTWLIPCVSNVPMIVASNVTVVKIEQQLYCVEQWPAPFDTYKASQDYTIILFVFLYMLPLVIVSTLYSCVIYKIWPRTPGKPSTTTHRLNSRRRRKALKMFVTIVVCFTLSWLPYHVTFFLGFFVEKFFCRLPKDLIFMSRFLAHSTSALNPCIYLAFNKDYRNGVMRLLNVI